MASFMLRGIMIVVSLHSDASFSSSPFRPSLVPSSLSHECGLLPLQSFRMVTVVPTLSSTALPPSTPRPL